MKNLSSYEALSDDDKKALLRKAYLTEKKTMSQVAVEIGHSLPYLRKQLVKYKIPLRTRSESLKLSIDNGNHIHPTKGKKHDQQTKDKISKKRTETWDNITPTDKEAFIKKRQQAWAAMSNSEINDLQSAAHAGLRTSAKDGSKLEKFLTEELMLAGFLVEFHRKSMVSNQELEMDLYLPHINTVIEIDGPTHFLPIFGEDRLAKTQAKDAEKNGLLLNAGLVVIRLQQYKRKNITKYLKKQLLDKLLLVLTRIKLSPPTKVEDRLIIICED